ncbi:MAG: hypothetical protein QXO12_02340 [Candidatus Pacearchaeota archaeon]
MKGYCCICFFRKIKDRKNFDHFLFAEILENKNIKKISSDVLIIKEKLLKEDGKKFLNEIFNLKREKNFLIAIEGTENYYLNKQLLELKRSNIAIVDIFFPYFNKKDDLHYAYSGINHVLLNIMKRNNIAIGIELEKILKAIEKNDFIYLSKIIQNANWARKKKVNFCLFLNAKNNSKIPDALDLFNFLLAIGFDTKQAKNCLIYPKIKLDLNKEIFKHKFGEVYIYNIDEEIKLIDYLKAIEA